MKVHNDRGGLRALVTESALYGMASLAGVLASFVLAPVYLHELSPAQFGTASLVTTVGTFLWMFSILALDTASHRMIWESEERDHRQRVFGTWLRTSLLTASTIAVLVGLAWAIASLSGHRSQVLDLTVVWGFSLPFRIAQHVRLQWARAHRKPLSAAVWSLSLALLTMVLGVVLVPVLHWGALGVIASQTIATIAVGTLALVAPVARRLLLTPLDRDLLRRMLRFSLPLLPTGLAGWFLAVGDRWILEIIYGSDAVGFYQAAFTITGLISLPLAAFNQAFPPWAFSIHTEEQAALRIRRAFAMVVLAATCGALAISLAAASILQIAAQADFESARSMVPYLAFAVVAQAVFSFTAIGCNIAQRNGPVAYAVLLGAAVILPVVWIADRWIGADSVALSTLVSQAVSAAFVTWSAERLWRVDYGWRIPAVAAAACGLAILFVA